MLRCFIVDDEQTCIDTLQLMLQKKFAHQVQLAGSTTDPAKAAGLIAAVQPDVVFLDVEMPAMTGIELLQSLGHIGFQVVFTTAHQHYALQAIKLNAMDYLLKPISLEELTIAIDKCRENRHQDQHRVNTFLEQVRQSSLNSRKIPLSSNNITQFVPVQEIVRIESSSNYSTVFFLSRPKMLVTKTLKDFEEQLTALNFLRVHHSHLINLEHVIGFRNEDGGYILMEGNDAIEISRRKKQEVMQRLQSL